MIFLMFVWFFSKQSEEIKLLREERSWRQEAKIEKLKTKTQSQESQSNISKITPKQNEIILSLQHNNKSTKYTDAYLLSDKNNKVESQSLTVTTVQTWQLSRNHFQIKREQSSWCLNQCFKCYEW
jgi:hypothetical protein